MTDPSIDFRVHFLGVCVTFTWNSMVSSGGSGSDGLAGSAADAVARRSSRICARQSPIVFSSTSSFPSVSSNCLLSKACHATPAESGSVGRALARRAHNLGGAEDLLHPLGVVDALRRARPRRRHQPARQRPPRRHGQSPSPQLPTVRYRRYYGTTVEVECSHRSSTSSSPNI